MREALQAAARETLRLCRPSKPAQAGLEPRAPAPRGRCACGLAKPVPRPLLVLRDSVAFGSYPHADSYLHDVYTRLPRVFGRNSGQ